MATQLKSQIFRRVHLSQMGQNLCQRVETTMEGIPLVRIRTRTARLGWEADLVERSNSFLSRDPLLH